MITATAIYLLLINTYDLPPDLAARMTCIAYEESKFKLDAVNYNNTNGTIDSGIFQINSIWSKKCKNLLDLHDNIKCAIFVYKKQGLKAWSTQHKCR